MPLFLLSSHRSHLPRGEQDGGWPPATPGLESGKKGRFLVLTAFIAQEPNGILIHGGLVADTSRAFRHSWLIPICTHQFTHRQPPLPLFSLLNLGVCFSWDMGPLGDTRVGQLYVLVCPGQTLFVPDVPLQLLITSPSTLKSVLVEQLN